jgi:hypothetical protein
MVRGTTSAFKAHSSPSRYADVTFRCLHRPPAMAKTIDAVADAVTDAEIALERAGRKVAGAVNRAVGGTQRDTLTRETGPGVTRSTTHDRRLERNSVDSLAQFCGLSLPTLNKRGWHMPSVLHVVSSPASTASTTPFALRRKRIDFVTGYCGLSLPSLLERIGTMAVDGRPAKTTPTSIASGPAERLDKRIRMKVDKPSSRPVVHRPIRREGADECARRSRRRWSGKADNGITH